MTQITYNLTTRSSLIVSPRANTAFYAALEDFSPCKIQCESKYLDIKKLAVIYPFYRYGEYTSYDPKSAKYYLPGSSVKGALRAGKGDVGGLMVDDVLIDRAEIVLRNLCRAQYLRSDTEKKATLGVFFENVGVEMLKSGVTLKGCFYAKDWEAAETLLKEANRSTKIKIEQMLEYLHELQTRKCEDALCRSLKEIEKNLSCYKCRDDVFLFGGYKGLMHSIEAKKGFPPESKGAIFVDCETCLPHGLVTIEIMDQSASQ